MKNFLAISKTDDFAELSYEEIKMWIASDDIEVSAEEDVYQIIVSWIDHKRNDRRKYLAELFAEVRLAYVSNDFLRYVVTNDLVKGNEECMNLVKYVAQSDDFRKSHLREPSLFLCGAIPVPSVKILFFIVQNTGTFCTGC